MNPADLTLSISPTLTTRNLAQSGTSTSALGSGLGVGAGVSLARVPILRVDLEPIYLQVKTALGDHWDEYKTALNHFILGHLNQVELAWVLNPILTPANGAGGPTTTPAAATATATTTATTTTTTDSSTGNGNGANANANANANNSAPSPLHLHNTLLAAIYANTLRDPPPSEVAPWVVATDKPTPGAKNAGASGANDKAEERLKREVMAMPARDRRRIKALKESGRAVNDGFAEAHAYRYELASRPPDTVGSAGAGGGAVGGGGGGGVGAGGGGVVAAATAAPAAPGGGSSARTNWDFEIRRRYAQPLAHETLEFPTQSDLQNRIEPLCFEEGVSGGVPASVLPGCAELLEQATEVYLKEMLGSLCAHSRANAEGCIQTRKFRRQLRREEVDVERGIVQRSAAGLLPVELDLQVKRQPLSVEDLRLALELKDVFLRHDPFLAATLAVPRRCEPEAQLHMHGMMANGSISAAGVGDRPMVNGFGASYNRGESMADTAPVPVPGAAAAAAAAATAGDWSWRGGGNVDNDDLLGTLDECLAFG